MSDLVINQPVAFSQVPRAGHRQGWIVSVAFWACLAFAAALYAAVALAPKLLARLTLEQESRTHQLQLVDIERQIGHLQKVIDAFKHDPGFAKELARIDFDAVQGEEERIPVESHLALPARAGAPDLQTVPPDLPWYAPVLRLLAYNAGVANTLLAIAAAAVLYAFACLNERRRLN